MTVRELGLKIQYHRKLKGMTLLDLANELGVYYTIVSRYENGNIDIPASKLLKIFEVLGIEIDFKM